MNKITTWAFFDELQKIADVVHPVPGGTPHIDPNELADPNDPTDPITRYQSMQRRKPILRDVLREGAIGAAAYPLITTTRDIMGKGVRETFKRPELRDAAGEALLDTAGKARLGSHFAPGGFGRKALAGAAVAGVATGLLPLIRSHMALKAEEENVKQQLGITPDTGLRSAVRRTVGVG